MRTTILFLFAICIMYTLVFVEAGLVAFFYWRSRRPKWPARFLTLARHRRAMILAVPAGLILLRLALLPWFPIREPRVTDEHSYLLMADTFSSGRLANPVHPMARHLQSIHILQQPKYASMYQPAQGAVLAVGQVVFGHPWFGVCLMAGVMTGAILWMLYGWLPPRWALLGGLIAAARIGLFSYWMNSYWGGAAAAFGGALLLGGLGRVLRRPSAAMGAVMGLGAAILALSRPFEGVVLCAGAGIVLLWKVRGWALPRVAGPVVAGGIIGVALLGLYFREITGSPLKPPELVQREPYAVAEIFHWQKIRPEPEYPDQAMHDFYADWEKNEFLRPLHEDLSLKVVSVWLFFLGPALTIPAIAAARRRLQPLHIVLLVVAAGFLLTPYFYAHYAAPASAAIFAVTVLGLRCLYTWRRSTRHGARLARAAALACFVVLPFRLLPNPYPSVTPFDWPMAWFWTSEGNPDRAAVLRRLSAEPGKHVVVVRYDSSHRAVDNEWVYNRADIDHAKVVLGRDLDAASNDEFVRYFRDRRAWIVYADEQPPRLEPYVCDKPPDGERSRKKI